jgi:hypothetical protein
LEPAVAAVAALYLLAWLLLLLWQACRLLLLACLPCGCLLLTHADLSLHPLLPAKLLLFLLLLLMMLPRNYLSTAAAGAALVAAAVCLL